MFWGAILFNITAETRLILLVLVVGALGGSLHGATSFVAFAGKEELRLGITRPVGGWLLGEPSSFVQGWGGFVRVCHAAWETKRHC